MRQIIKKYSFIPTLVKIRSTANSTVIDSRCMEIDVEFVDSTGCWVVERFIFDPADLRKKVAKYPAEKAERGY